MAEVKLNSVYKIYPGDVEAVSDVSLKVQDQEFLVLVGPSGCGKSTTLRMIAGLEEITRGTIIIGDREVNHVPPKDRDIAMVFQNYALYPHMTVYDNMGFGLKLRKFKKDEIDTRVREAATILGIEELLQRRPKALSGGQRQRVAVGRAIVRKPSVFLFDEPLSNLDAKMRVQMRVELSRLHKQLQATMIYVTHDQIEAMTMGTRIVVMKDGEVQQVDAPIDLYDNPVNRFVAGFIGTPPMNFLTGTIAQNNGTLRFEEGSFGIDLPAEWKEKAAPYNGKSVTLGIRPEEIGSTLAEANENAQLIKGHVDVTEPMGAETYVHVNTGKNKFIARVDAHREFMVGDEATLRTTLIKSHLFDDDTEQTIV